MNENTELDLEWAKRGGVVYAEKANIIYLCLWTKTNDDRRLVAIASKFRGYCFQTGSDNGKTSLLHHQYVNVLRMATRAECESAGVEYIERPVSAEELRDDKEMLDFLIKNPSVRIESEDGDAVQLVVGNYGAYTTWGEGATPREAIRAAMKGGE